MLLNVNELQHKALENIINIAISSLGHPLIGALVHVLQDALHPVSHEQLEELGYVKKPEEQDDNEDGNS